MSNKIVFLNTCHYSLDDRVFYHQAKCLSKNNFEILIISTKENLNKNEGNISINSFDDKTLSIREQKNKILGYLKTFSPDIVICDSPLAVIYSKEYKKSSNIEIIYDITEWYPSKKNLQNTKGIRKYIKLIILTFANLYAGLISNSFIFGEHYKSIPFKTLFFWKRNFLLPYYPDLHYIRCFPTNKIEKEINLLYSGKINTEKGIDSIIKSLYIASKKCPDTQFKLKIIGYFPSKNDENHFQEICSNKKENVQIQVENILPFINFCQEIGKSDIYLDLRQIDIENNLCLPIKLFYYLACGKPIIYSNLRSIRKGVRNINFGHLCDPNDSDLIASHIINYIQHPKTYTEHSKNALKTSKLEYNWNLLEKDFINFIYMQKNYRRIVNKQ